MENYKIYIYIYKFILSGKIVYGILPIYRIDGDHWSAAHTLSWMGLGRNKRYMSDKIKAPCYQ